jgi:hypothetical protein
MLERYISVSDVVGYLGAATIVVGYFLNQRGVLRSDGWRYPAINLAGSLLVMVSLLQTLNPPSVVIEVFWSAISVYGIQRSLRAR